MHLNFYLPKYLNGGGELLTTELIKCIAIENKEITLSLYCQDSKKIPYLPTNILNELHYSRKVLMIIGIFKSNFNNYFKAKCNCNISVLSGMIIYKFFINIFFRQKLICVEHSNLKFFYFKQGNFFKKKLRIFLYNIALLSVEKLIFVSDRAMNDSVENIWSINRKKIFVFGDIPILFKSQFLLIQNRLYFDPRFKSFKSFLGRVFLKASMHWVKTIFVQTEAMKSVVRLSYNNKILVCSHPSGRQQLDRSIIDVSGNDNLVIALTSAYKHKNNELLKEMRSEHDTMLYITLDNAPRYLQENIIYIGSIGEETVSKFYAENPIILVTSYLESYSLPLVEASELGLRFVCPDEDYSEHFQSPNMFVYEQDNAESLNSALAKAMNHNVIRQKFEYHWSTLLEYFCHE